MFRFPCSGSVCPLNAEPLAQANRDTRRQKEAKCIQYINTIKLKGWVIIHAPEENNIQKKKNLPSNFQGQTFRNIAF